MSSRNTQAVSVAIVGAGPYGLSLAAHLRKQGVSFRIFGTPMQNWAERMPKGMLLKSEGFASSLFDPDRAFTLKTFCAERGLPYEDVGAPVPGASFVAYGQEFARRLVPTLEPVDITAIDLQYGIFELTTAAGVTLEADRVVLAVGITHFAYTPPTLAGLPPERLSHSLSHHDLSPFAGRRIAVVGGGASAVDLAGLLQEAGADAHLVARRESIAFHAPTLEPRPLTQRVLNPRSGLGLGWRSRMCTDAPLVFHRLPAKLRRRIVSRHLGPAPGWFARQKIEGRVPVHLGATIREAALTPTGVALHLDLKNGATEILDVDHVIAATGFRPEIPRLRFLHPALQQAIHTDNEGAPILTQTFESSVPGLFFTGLASAHCFGPVTRFAFGAKFTGKHLANHLAKTAIPTPNAHHIPALAS